MSRRGEREELSPAGSRSSNRHHAGMIISMGRRGEEGGGRVVGGRSGDG